MLFLQRNPVWKSDFHRVYLMSDQWLFGSMITLQLMSHSRPKESVDIHEQKIRFGQERTDDSSSVCPGYWSCYTDPVKEDALRIKALQAHTFDWILIHIQTQGSD